MKVADVLIQVREMINDTAKIEYSDDELLRILNRVQDYIADTCINKQFSRFLKTATLNSGDSLPDDFVVEDGVFWKDKKLKPVSPSAQIKQGELAYKLIGNKIEAGVSPLTLLYYAYPHHYKSLDDDLVLPPYFNNLLIEMVAFFALNRNEFNTSVEQSLSALFEQKLIRLISRYGFSKIPLNLPFEA